MVKLYIVLNTKLRTNATHNYEIDLNNLKNNAVFGETMENVTKHRNIMLVTHNKRGNQVVSEPNYKLTRWFSENLIATGMVKGQVKMTKTI